MTEFFSHPVPAVILLLGLLVFVHELGHFLVGRWCGIAVEIFSIGFGPPIARWRFRGTEYRLAWIPLGGFVKFAGAHPAEDVPPGLKGRAFLKTPLPQRAATILAGPLANFLLAIVVYTVLGGAGIPHPPALIGEVIEGSAAEAAGIRPEDVFVRIDEKPIETWRDLESIISASAGKELSVTVRRGEQEVMLRLTPKAVDTVDFTGKPVTVGRAGIARGRQPPIVTVLGESSPAQLAGLRTGDRVMALVVAGEERVLNSYPELEEALADAARRGVETVTLSVREAPAPRLDAQAEPTPADTRTATLNLTTNRAAQDQVQDPRALMSALGLRDAQLTVGAIMDPRAEVLRRGDLVLSWNGVPIDNVYELHEALMTKNEPQAVVRVLRDHQEVELTLPLKAVEAQRPEGPVTLYTLPVLFWAQPELPDPVVERYENPIAAVGYGLRETGRQTMELVRAVTGLVTGEMPLKALGGPILIAKVAGDSVRHGWQTFLTSMALISINLGLLNLFPIPVLDGGQLVLMGAEAVRRRPLREAAIENFQKIGFVMIMALVVLATYNDLSRFWKSMLATVVDVFQ